jgi:hypothetical protein
VYGVLYAHDEREDGRRNTRWGCFLFWIVLFG